MQVRIEKIVPPTTALGMQYYLRTGSFSLIHCPK